MILEYGNVTYEDLSVMQFFGCPWRDAKAKTPFSQLPIIVVDTEVVGQSGAISRYCSRLVPSVLPTDSLAIARCDAIYDTAAELNSINPLVNVYKGKEQRAKLTTFLEETFKPKLASLDRMLPESGGPFCFGAAPMYCDFNVYHHLDQTRLCAPTCLDAHPKVLRFMAAFEALPKLQEYLTSRPKCVGIGSAPMLEPPFGPRQRKLAQLEL